jgi:recombination protein RecT
MSNQLTTQPITTKDFFSQQNVKAKFEEMLGKRAPQFITSVLQIVASNSLLINAEPSSVYQAAAVSATLDLPLNNNIGFAYIVPYNQSYKDASGQWKKKVVAQFQMGYKGFIQLAQRSGQFKTISASAIHEGELISQNPLTGFEFDFTKRTSNKVIGYAAYFKLLNGFEKTHYMTVEDLTKHGKKFSQTFKTDKGLWADDFDSMATKTVLKLLLSKFAPLSIEMQKATIADQMIVDDADNLKGNYVDNETLDIDTINFQKEQSRVIEHINNIKTIAELEAFESTATANDCYNEWALRLETLKKEAKNG